MGTQCAPPYAQMFMFYIEKKLVYECMFILCYKRYIDDVFFVLSHTKHLATLQARMQMLCKGIVFTFSGDGHTCVMLDLEIYRGERFMHEKKFDFCIYQKKINRYHYITFFSEHPPELKRGFIQGELIRYAIRSSDFAHFDKLRKLFFTRLRARGYPASFLMPLFKGINYDCRGPYLAPERRSGKRKHDVPLLLNVPFSRFAKVFDPRSSLRRRWIPMTKRAADVVLFPLRPRLVYSKGRSVFDITRHHQRLSRRRGRPVPPSDRRASTLPQRGVRVSNNPKKTLSHTRTLFATL